MFAIPETTLNELTPSQKKLISLLAKRPYLSGQLIKLGKTSNLSQALKESTITKLLAQDGMKITAHKVSAEYVWQIIPIPSNAKIESAEAA